MNVNTKLKLQDEIDNQLSKRKKELSQLNLLFQSTDSLDEKDIINRLIIPHVYSHYEGFIKNASVFYLHYVLETYNPANELPDNIFMLEVMKNINTCVKENSGAKYVEFIKWIRERPKRLTFKPDFVIETHSNLKTKNLREILFICGIPYDSYWIGKSLFIDEILLKYRNLIAHGELVPVDDQTVIECITNVMDILQTYKMKLEEKI